MLQTVDKPNSKITQTSGSVATFLANIAAIDILSFTISDSSVNIASNLNALQAASTKIAGITLTDTLSPLAITASQLSKDADTLAKISGDYTLTVSAVKGAKVFIVAANTHVTEIRVIDTNANIAANLNALQAASNKITSITLSGTHPQLTITATQFTNDADVLAKISGNYTLAVTGVETANVTTVAANTYVTKMKVIDTSANIAASLNTLQAVSDKITSITQVGTHAPLAITATQLANDAGALVKISGTYTLAVSELTSDKVVIAAANRHVTAMTVIDTNISIAANLNALQAASAKITSITLSDALSPLSITATQLIKDAGAFAKISGTFTLVVSGVTGAKVAKFAANTHVTAMTVIDTDANIAANLNALQAASNKITSITLSGTHPQLTITATQFTNDAEVLAKISGNYTLAVLDTSANIAVNIDALQVASTKITSITQKGTHSPLVITATQFINDTDALAKIRGSYNLSVSGVESVDVSTVAANTHVTKMTVIDTGANIASNLNALQAASSKITSITLSDVISPLVITATQLANDASALAKISGTYTLEVSGVKGAKVATVAANTHVTAMTVNDTNSSIAANLNALQAASAKITSITLSDVLSPLAITATQLVNDASALAKINGNFTLEISEVVSDKASIIAANSYVSKMAVIDTSANIAINLNALQTVSAKITSITLNGAYAPLAITATQLVNDSSVLAKISGNYTLAVSGVEAANVATVLANPHVTSLTVLNATAADVSNLLSNPKITQVSVIDTTANIQNNWQELQSAYGAGTLTGVAISDGGTVQLSLVVGGSYDNLTAPALSPILALASQVTGGTIGMIIGGSDSINNPIGVTAVLQKVDSYTYQSPVVLQFNGLGGNTLSSLFEVNSVLNAHPSWSIAPWPFQVANGTTAISLRVGPPQGSNFIPGLLSLDQINNAKLLNILATGGYSDTNPNGNNYHWAAITPTAAEFIQYYSSAFFTFVGIQLKGSLSDSAANIVLNLDALAPYASQLTTTPIQLTDNFPPTISVSALQANNDAAVLNGIQSSYLLSIADSASNLNTLDLSKLTTKYLELAPTVLDATLTISAVISDVNLTHSGLSANAQISEIAINSGAGTEIDITDGINAYQIILTNTIESNLVVYPQVDPGLAVQNPVISVSILSNNVTYYEDLAKVGKLGSLTLTDSGTPAITITNAQLIADSAVFSAITTPYSLHVSGVTAGDVSTLLANPKITQVSVIDTTANIKNNWQELQSAYAAGTLTGVAISDGGTVQLSLMVGGSYDNLTAPALSPILALASQVTGGTIGMIIGGSDSINNPIGVTAVLQKVDTYTYQSPVLLQFNILGGNTLSSLFEVNSVLNAHPSWSIASWPSQGSGPISLRVGPPQGSNFIPGLLSLDQINNAKLLNILATGGYSDTNPNGNNYHWAAITPTAAEFIQYYSSAFFTFVGIQLKGSLSDSAANIVLNLDALAPYASQLTTTPIQLTDNFPPTISVSALQANNDAAVLNGIQSSYLLSIADSASNLNTLDLSKLTTKYLELAPTVLDATLTISAVISDVNLTHSGLSANAQISEIAINSGAGTEIDITDGINAYQIILTNTIESNLVVYPQVDPGLAVQNPVISVSILSNNITYYEDLAKVGKLGSLTLTDSGTPAITITNAQLIADSAVFSAITTPYSLHVSGVTAGDVSTLLANPKITQVSVIDTTANIKNNWQELQSAYGAGTLTGVAISDGGTVQLSLVVGGSYDNLTAPALSPILALASQVTGGTIGMIIGGSDSINNPIGVTAVLQKVDSYTYQSPVVLQFNGLGGNTLSSLFEVNSVLNAHPSWSIAPWPFQVANGTTAISLRVGPPQGSNFIPGLLSLDQINNAKLLNILATGGYSDTNPNGDNYHWAAITPTAAEFIQYYSSAFFTFVGIQLKGSLSDSAANIVLNQDALAPFASQLTTTPIQLTDNFPPTISVSALQANNDAAVLNGIQSSYLLSIADSASNLNMLDLSKLTAKYIELAPTVLDATLTISAVISDVNLTHSGLSANAQISEIAINSGAGTEIDITDGVNTYQIILTNTLESKLVVYAPVAPGLAVPNPVFSANTLTSNHLFSSQDNIINGSENDDILIGNNLNNTLNGYSGNDVLDGGAGNDILIGGTGSDTLTGGDGSDLFKLNALTDLGFGSARDIITDFTVGQDKIDLSAIDADTSFAGDQAFKLVTTAFSAAAQISYNSQTGIISINTNMDTNAEYEIQLIGTPSQLSDSDFVL